MWSNVEWEASVWVNPIFGQKNSCLRQKSTLNRNPFIHLNCNRIELVIMDRRQSGGVAGGKAKIFRTIPCDSTNITFAKQKNAISHFTTYNFTHKSMSNKFAMTHSCKFSKWSCINKHILNINYSFQHTHKYTHIWLEILKYTVKYQISLLYGWKIISRQFTV